MPLWRMPRRWMDEGWREMISPENVGMVAAADLAVRLALVRPLLGEINDLKRVRVAGRSGSLADQGFARSWGDLIGGSSADLVARREIGFAVAAARLGGIDAAILDDAGLSRPEVESVLQAAIHAVTGPLGPAWLDRIGLAGVDLADPALFLASRRNLPEFVGRLQTQPRAGATRPGYARLVLEPPENHAEHCYITAVYAGLTAPCFGADPAVAFVAGLAHHLHNAYLPDSGFAGEELLGHHLLPIMERCTERAIEQLPAPLVAVVRAARAILPNADTPEGRAFHAGDVFDRVLQMEQYARVAAFETRQALRDLDLVHPGPTQGFHQAVLAAVGLWS